MNRRAFVFYYIISIAFLLVLVGLGGYRIRARSQQNLQASRQSLEALRIAALSTYLAEGGFDSEYFRTLMRDNFRRTERLRVLALYSAEEGFHYLLAADRDLLAAVPGPGFAWKGAPEYRLRPLVHVRLSVPFSPGIRSGLVLDGVFWRLDREDLYPILRELFVVVLVYLGITTLLLLVAAVSRPVPAGDRPRTAAGPPRLSSPEHPRRGSLDSLSDRRDLNAQGPGLYSPETGLGWRDFLPQRLSQELERAASFDQDLAFLLVAAKPSRQAGSPEIRGSLFRQLGKYTLESFPLRDLDFEYDPHAVAVILPDRSLDQGLEEAKTFQRKLLQASWAGSGGVRVSAGLSSRSGRLISGTRLLIEASRSLKKAETSGVNQIVAFRADPQKFRQALFSGRGE